VEGSGAPAAPSGGGRAVQVPVPGGARADAARWERLAKRLRLAAPLDPPVAVRLRALRPEDAPPLRRAGAVRRPDPRRGPARPAPPARIRGPDPGRGGGRRPPRPAHARPAPRP